MKFSIPTLSFADIPGAGRFTRESVSQQTAMEMLCAGSADLDRIQDKDGEFTDIQTWKGLQFDSDGNIIEIVFRPNQGLGLFADSDEEEDTDDSFPAIGRDGALDFQWIPCSVRIFDAHDLALHGTVDTTVFPRKLERLIISANELDGELNLLGLPRTLKLFHIQFNKFSGNIRIADLPRCLESFEAAQNAFTGEIHLGDLPPCMRRFSVRGNRLSGKLDMRSLPISLASLDLTRNDFAQDTLVANIDHLPMYCITIDKAKFGKIIDDEGDDMKDRMAS